MRKAKFVACMAMCLCSIPTWADAECDEVRAKYQKRTVQTAWSEYSFAYCLARDGNVDLAFQHLEASIQQGFRELSHIESDPDFTALHADKRWAGILAAVNNNENQYVQSINAELYQIYKEDQADRSTQNIDWSKVAPRDQARSMRVREIAKNGQLKQGDDYFHAAMVMQHGESSESYLQAQQWAEKAFELNPKLTSANWLAAAAEDRYLQSINKPQIWGTQYKLNKETGKWSLEPIDRKAKTDDERAAKNVPSLAQSEEREKQMNQ